MITLTLRSERIAALRRTIHRIRQRMPVCRVQYQVKITLADPQALEAVRALLGSSVSVAKE